VNEVKKQPHVHAELIKLWADGAEIQRQITMGGDSVFIDDHTPTWNPLLKYRIKPPLSWLQEREAYARGEVVQYRSPMFDWKDYPTSMISGGEPGWNNVCLEWRIRPARHVMEYEVIRGRVASSFSMFYNEDKSPKPNLRLTFCEEDGLIAAEVLKKN
jgi:hypothetical protein